MVSVCTFLMTNNIEHCLSGAFKKKNLSILVEVLIQGFKKKVALSVIS